MPTYDPDADLFSNEPEPGPEPERLPGAPNLQNGTYTVSGPDGHFTMKLHTVKKGKLAGERIFSLLVGPDNTGDYQGVAFWNDERKIANVWKKHAHPLYDSAKHLPVTAYNWNKSRWSKTQKKVAVLLSLALREGGGWWGGGAGYELLLEGRCVVCNRKLTTPESIKSGIGPVCSSRVS